MSNLSPIRIEKLRVELAEAPLGLEALACVQLGVCPRFTAWFETKCLTNCGRKRYGETLG
jgi:hypothetical protein